MTPIARDSQVLAMADSTTIPPTASQTPPRPPSPMVIDGSEQDLALAHSEYLSRREVLQRRSHRVKQLARLYKDHYWSLMEELKGKYREYYWNFGKSPFKEDENDIGVDCDERIADNAKAEGSIGWGDDIRRCEVTGCKAKAMALTKYCHSHILSDSKQRLYKGCTFVIKSMQSGPLLCSKPVLRSMIPSYCPGHLQKGEKCFARDLRKAGLNVSSTNKIHPDFQVLVSEYIRQIQIKRKAARKAILIEAELKEGNMN